MKVTPAQKSSLSTSLMPDGSLASNVELVRHVVEVAKAMGREIASPDEAREILSMPKENIDRILPQLDPSMPLEKLATLKPLRVRPA